MSSLHPSNAFRLPPHATARLFAYRQKDAVSKLSASLAVTKSASQISPVTSPILHYTLRHSTIYGSILIATSSKGISAILLGGEASDETFLEKDLQRRFPNHLTLKQDSVDEKDSNLNLICRFLDGKEDPKAIITESLKLDLKGTPFQMTVWQALMQIPSGTTETYQQLTKRAGLPSTSIRAVANACGQNHIAILIPCHRIIRSNGGLGGYHWGVETKKRLLQAERKGKADCR